MFGITDGMNLKLFKTFFGIKELCKIRIQLVNPILRLTFLNIKTKWKKMKRLVLYSSNVLKYNL